MFAMARQTRGGARRGCAGGLPGWEDVKSADPCSTPLPISASLQRVAYRQGDGMPLAGACCSDPEYVEMAPDADASVVRTDPCCTSWPFWITPMYAPVMPMWSLEEYE